MLAMSSDTKKIELSEFQKGIYFDCQIDDPISYTISATILFENLQEEPFENACKLLIAEQEALRSSIILINDFPSLMIHNQVPFVVEKQTIINSPHSVDLVNAIIAEEITIPLDLSKAPLCRMKLLQLEAKKHLLIICIHHLIGDGLSLDILIKKILNYYRKLIHHELIILKKDCSFSNFIQQENINLNSDKYATQRAYWMQKMQGVEPLAFQIDYPKRKKISGVGCVKSFAIPDEISIAVHKLAVEQESTVFMIFLGAFVVLINRYVHSSDITLVSPFSYRPGLELEDTIGCFVHMLPMRFKLASAKTFSSLLQAVSKELIEVYKNIGYPNNLIIRDNLALNMANVSSIFDVSFVYDVYETITEGDVKAHIVNQSVVTFPGNLMIILNKVDNKSFINIQYKKELFSDKSIELLGVRYLKIIKELITHVNVSMANLDFFLENEKSRVLHEFNQSNYFTYRPQAIINIFHEKVIKNPHRIALIDNQKTATYEAVNTRANCLAYKIQQYKKQSNECIGIQLERSIDLVIAILAVLKAGCAYVPIEPTYPSARKEFIFRDANISILMTSHNLLQEYKHNLQFILVDDYSHYNSNVCPVINQYDPTSLAYIAYTSGSTGNPKGVMIENHSVVNILLDLQRRFPVVEQDVLLFKTPFTFDISVTELFGWFFGEGSLFILKSNGERNPQLILDIITKYQITHVNFVPSMFRLFLELFEEKTNIVKLQSLKWIFIGGEKVTRDIVEKFRTLGTNIQLENMYGPTECTLWATHCPIEKYRDEINVPIGYPLNGTRCYVVRESNQLQPVGIPGELCLSGVGLARGYLNLEQATQEKFIANPFFKEGIDPEYYRFIYRTGDIVRWLSNGNLDFLGRMDSQVKIRGMRLELEEIENVLMRYPGITQAIVLKKEMNKSEFLCAYYLSEFEIFDTKLKDFLLDNLPPHMIPTFYVHKLQLPLTASGKVDRKILMNDRNYERKIASTNSPPQTELENTIASVWREVLGIKDIGLDDNFFEKGGHSLSLIQVNLKLKKILKIDFSVNLQFQLPTIRLLAEYFSKNQEKSMDNQSISFNDGKIKWRTPIAIIGMSINVPGAKTIQDFWDNLKNSRESIYFYSDDELIKLGIPLTTLNSPNYVKAKGRVEGIEYFDPLFFDYTPAEVRLMSPQLRLLYPGLWEALEDAGYFPSGNFSKIGLFLGASDDFEWYKKVILGSNAISDKFQAVTLNTNHFLATRLAYKLDLRGPVFSALTGCSTTLVTAHLACQSLILGECDLAIAGGITVELPNEGGYFYEEGMMFSPDGHCRPFDAQAVGTFFSNGMGLVVLKRLNEAIADGDHIYAVIKGSAINNDGKQKLGFSAPSPNGQAEVIQSAYRVAEIDPVTVSYVEAHGTGTTLGDPVEVESLTKAFATTKKQFCIMGSVKGNIGHTDTAAGIVGLAKVALSLKHQYIPGTVNYHQPNPKIDFSNTPFVVKSEGTDWKNRGSLLRAGINSFGVGGTNAHMVLEEAPVIKASTPANYYNLLLFSAKSSNALVKTSEKILKFLQQNPTINLSDVTWTLQVGRHHFPLRKFFVENQTSFEEFPEEMLNKLDEAVIYEVKPGKKNIYFMFPGQSSQYLAMGRDLYYQPNSNIANLYKRHFNQVINLLSKEQRNHFLDAFYGTNSRKINDPQLSRFAFFSVGYALTKSLMELGIKPKAMLGHNIGEITAAIVAGIFELKDAVEIIMCKTSEEFSAIASNYKMNDPMIPIISNDSGHWLVLNELKHPEYWSKHILENTHFTLGLTEILKDKEGIFIEVGPGHILSALARQHETKTSSQYFINLMRHPKEMMSDVEYLYKKIGQLWCIGVEIDWYALKGDTIRHRLSLPSYVFDKEYFPIEKIIDLPPTSIDAFLTNDAESSLPLEKVIIEAYQRALGFDHVDRNQDFFALGGDSLIAISVAANINRELSLKIDIKDLFQYSTPAALAEYLSKNFKEESSKNIVISPIVNRNYYPLSSAQARIYMLYLLDKTGLGYNMPSAFIINGALDTARFQQTFKKLVKRHESLRTTFTIIDNQPVQIVHPNIKVAIDYSEQHVASNEEINALIFDFVKPFDLETVPLFRIKLIKIDVNRYLFLLDIHHIIVDGTSMEIIVRDFNQLYSGELAPLTIQYRDFAVWQNQFLQSQAMIEQKNFWLEHLAGDLPVLEFPTDFPRSAIKNFSGARVNFTLDETLTQRLINFSKACGTTLFMTLISTWYVLLARYSGQEEIIVGVPLAGRNQKEIEETVGMFINMLALRNWPGNKKRFVDFLSEVKNNVLNAFKNQDYQFNELIHHLNLKRELNRGVLFDVWFDFQNMKTYNFNIENIHFSSYDFSSNTAICDLLLTCQENKKEGVIQGFLEYATELFKRETIERLVENFKVILNSILKEKEILIENIDIVSVKEKQLLEQFNNTLLPFNSFVTIQDSFRKNVETFPNKIALLVASGKKFTYSQLNASVNILAEQLIKLGVVQNSMIGVMTDRDEYLVITLLAILKAGGAYVPIDPNFPQERIQYMLSCCQVDLLISPRHYANKVDFKGIILDPYSFSSSNNTSGKTNIKFPKNSQDDLVCVIFTSGSTGNPKGVMLRQFSLGNFIEDIKNQKIFNNFDDRIISLATISFDLFTFESIVPLCTGHSVYLADKNEQLDPVLAGKKILAHQITHLSSTVSRIKLFIENSEFLLALKRLKCILSVGEHLPLLLLKNLQNLSQAKIYNVYGPTETTIWSTTKDLTQASSITIGKPIANTQIYIVNLARKLQPVGVFGELCIAGAGLGRGYLPEVDGTKNKFTRLPDLDNIPCYRTGDRARFLENGELELRGRFDSQVKVRGYRIELNEIEKIAETHDHIRQVACIVFDDQDNNKQLALYYCVKKDSVCDNSCLKSWIEKKLPHYMLPSYLLLLESLPILPNGKINRKVLPLPRKNIQATEITSSSVNKDAEAILLSLWKEVLSVDTITINDNFFDLGGNSFGLIQINNKLNVIFDRTIPLLQFFQHPTIASFVKSLNLPRNKVQQETALSFIESEISKSDIAVIGLAGKFPGADNIDTFWKNILVGKESLTHFNDEELIASGIDAELLAHPNYIKVKGFLDEVEYFDSAFFDYTDKDADLMDPQIRILHQCAWEVLENAAYNPVTYNGRIGLFVGSGFNILWVKHLLDATPAQNLLNSIELFTLNEKDFVSTRLSYKLNLKGPSFTIQTACSTSLVAIHQAVQSLINGECDMAIAGGVSISYPRKEGYLWHEGMIFSRDGHCKPFANDSSGIISGNGCGLVMLKPLTTAIRDRDHIYAVIKGSAINNDGIEKVGYTAPSIEGQRHVIETALKKARVKPEDICYLEAHGTGTKIGDPIEIEALKRAWGSDKKQFCAIGSVKANIGHCDAAAGVASFIKTVLLLEQRVLPPLINFNGPNPMIDFKNSPFYINTKTKSITDTKQILKAAVSSFGIGGTNAHVILEQSPVVVEENSEEETNLLLFSARSPEALKRTAATILNYLQNHPHINLTDAAWTLQMGRKSFEYRKALCIDRTSINDAKIDVKSFLENPCSKISGKKTIIFNFSQQSGNLKLDLYHQNRKSKISAIFKENMDEVLACLPKQKRKNFMEECLEQDTLLINDNGLHRIALFATSYSLAKTLIEIGVVPNAVMGNGLGEVVAMTIAGNLKLVDAVHKINETEPVKALATSQKSFTTTQIPLLSETAVLETNGCTDLVEKQQYKIISMFVENENTELYLTKKSGEIWCEGVEIDWKKIHDDTKRKHLPLPTYIFDKKYHNADIRPNIENKFNIYADDMVKQKLALIWYEIFGHEVKEEDEFFALGGDSLKAANLAAQIQKNFGIEMPLTEIFNYTVFKQMCDWLWSHAHRQVFDKIQPVPRQVYYATSSAQKRIYAVHQLLDKTIPYNLAEAFLIEGPVEKEKLKRVFDTLVQRHEAFRTRFDIVNNEVVQIIEDEVQSVVEFGVAEEFQIHNEILEYMRPFDLAKAPLLRVKLLSINDNYHVLLLDSHHIIIDQSSITIFVREFNKLYSGNSLLPLTIQYKDFAAWQNTLLKSMGMERQINYWKNEFKHPIPVLNMPTDFPRPRIQSFIGERISFVLDNKLNEQINHISKKYALTPYMIFMAAFKLLLWKYTGQEDLIIGTAVAGRRHADLASVIGMFVNTLAIRTKIEDSLTMSEYFQYIKKKMLDAYENQDCQFEMLLELLNLEKDLSRNPLFDVVINYIDMGEADFVLDNSILKPWPNMPVYSKFDLTWTIEKKSNNYIADMEFNTALFKRETIEDLVSRLIHILTIITEENALQLTELTIVSSAERKRLLYDLNQTASNYPRDKTVIELFEETVQAYEDNIALIWNDTEISYCQLNEQINKVTILLMKHNLKLGDRIAILMDRSPLQIIAIFAILKMGCSYVPIDTEYPTQRINFILKDSNVRLLLTHSQINLNEIEKTIASIYLDVVLNSIKIKQNELASVEKRSKTVGADNISYIMYTSGSTGKPKGILTTHRNIVRLVRKNNFLEILATDRLLQLSNYVFDGSVLDIFGALLNGASLVMMSKETVIEMSALTQLIQQKLITVFYSNSALFNMLVEYDITCLSNIRKVLIGGEALSVTHIRKAFNFLGPNKLINGYGPTEATVFGAYYPIDEIDPSLNSIPIGYPLTNARLYILDKYKHPVPLNIVGELYIGGDGVAEGYLNCEELMQRRFLKDPFIANGKMYRTGDLVRRLPNDAILFVGREDFQVKIRGYRIELGEIEFCIKEIPGIQNAIVVAKQDNAGSHYIAAYYTIDKQKNFVSPSPENIREKLCEKLPNYMIPSRIIGMASLPLNTNGKIDLKALPDIDEKYRSSLDVKSPRNHLETVIHEHMKKILDNNHIGINDDFFKCGGHSIKAIALVHALSQIGISLKVNQIFLYPTVAKLAALPELINFNNVNTPQIYTKTLSNSMSLHAHQVDVLAENIEITNRTISYLISSAKVISQFPLAPIQIMHWSQGSNFSGFSSYLEGDMDERVVCNRIAGIIQNNQLLHSIIQEEKTPQWYQYDVSKLTALLLKNIPYLDLREYEEQTQQEIIRKISSELFLTIYRPGTVSWRLCCLRLSRHQHLVIWAFDHVAFDGMSSEILQNQLKNNFLQLPSQPIQRYQDYVALLQLGPRKISENKLLKKFALHKWQENNTFVMNQLEAMSNATQATLNIELPFNDVSMRKNPWRLALDFVVELLKSYLGINKIPLVIVNYGRSYSDQDFYNCVGEFLDMIPILIMKNVQENQITAILEECRRHNINFLSLLYDSNLSQKFSKVVDLLVHTFKSSGRTKKFILFNFQGFIGEREKSIFQTATQGLLEAPSISQLYISANYDSAHLNILLESQVGFNFDKINPIIKQVTHQLNSKDYDGIVL